MRWSRRYMLDGKPKSLSDCITALMLRCPMLMSGTFMECLRVTVCGFTTHLAKCTKLLKYEGWHEDQAPLASKETAQTLLDTLNKPEFKPQADLLEEVLRTAGCREDMPVIFPQIPDVSRSVVTAVCTYVHAAFCAILWLIW